MAKSQPPRMSRACAASSKARCCRGLRTGRRNWPIVRLICEQAFGEALDPDKLERLGRCGRLDRKLGGQTRSPVIQTKPDFAGVREFERRGRWRKFVRLSVSSSWRGGWSIRSNNPRRPLQARSIRQSAVSMPNRRIGDPSQAAMNSSAAEKTGTMFLVGVALEKFVLLLRRLTDLTSTIKCSCHFPVIFEKRIVALKLLQCSVRKTNT